MKTTWDKDTEPSITAEGRQHPYQGAVNDPQAQYYDLKIDENNDNIPNLMEDFIPYNYHQAVHNFFGFLSWINGPNSVLETNDCAFRYYQNENNHRAEGRVMVFLRNQQLNLINGFSNLLTRFFLQQLEAINQNFERGQFKVYRYPTTFTEIQNENLSVEFNQIFIESHITVINFEAFGNDMEETFQNLEVVIQTLEDAATNIDEAFFDAHIYPDIFNLNE